jgi:hypothetical protein
MQQNHDDVDVNYANDKGRIIICAYLLFYCIKWWKCEEQYSVGGKVALLFLYIPIPWSTTNNNVIINKTKQATMATTTIT